MLSFSCMRQLYKAHAQIQVSGLHSHENLVSQIIQICSLHPNGSLKHARNVVEHYDHTYLSSWNSLIRDNATRNSPREALRVFLAMRARGVRPDTLTYPFLFKACSAISGLREGKQIQADVLKYGLDPEVYINNTLIHFYGSCKVLDGARRVFDEMPVRDIVSWNSMIAASAGNLRSCDCVGLFCMMRQCGFEPNETSMVGLLSACAETGNLIFGKWVHSQVTVTGLFVNCELGTSFVNMYAKCGDIYSARRMFNHMMVKNVWTWSAMILGLAQHGVALKALEYFEEMKRCKVEPNYVTFIGVLCACSHARLVEDGIRFFHQMQYKYGIKPTIVHYGAMLDCLSRSGRLIEAYNFIKDMPIKPDAVLWRTLYSACYIHDVNDYTGVAEKVRVRLIELEPSRCGNYVILANKCAEVRMWEKAEYFRSSMTDRGLQKVAAESCIQVGSSMCRFVSGKICQDSYKGIYPLLGILNLHMKINNDDLSLLLG